MESRVPDFDAPYYLVNHNNNMDTREELRTVERLSEYAKLLWKVIQELLPDNYIACKGHGIEHLNDVLCRALEYRTLKYRTNESITDYIKNNFRLSNVDFYSFNLDSLYNKYKDDMEMNFYVLITATFTHDLFTNIDRKHHHILAKVFVNKTLYQILVNDYHKTNPSGSVVGIKKMLNCDQLYWILGEASFCVAEHRASSSLNPSTILSYIFTVADRDIINAEDIYSRTLSISKEQVDKNDLVQTASILSLKSLMLLNEGKIKTTDIKIIAKALMANDDMGFDDLNTIVGSMDFRTVLIHLRTKIHLIEKFSKSGYIFKNNKGKLYLFLMQELYPELYKSYFSKLKKLTKMEFEKDYSEA